MRSTKKSFGNETGNRIRNLKNRSKCSSLAYPGLLLFTVFLCWFFVGRYGVFGASVDWISQHSVIPDYFRQQFYATGELFPEFAANLGGGQNIYNFAYYGLYNPIILISYLFPSVKMGDYLMAASVACLCASVLLLYYWLGKRNFSVKIRLFSTLLFLLAGPMIYHSYMHVMFVNYMPFLCMGFLGVDCYFDKGKRGLYTCSVCLMILTSFYFSIGGMLVLIVYGLYRYAEKKSEKRNILQEKNDTRWRVVFDFFREGVQFLVPMFLAVLMNGVLLLPTALTLLGRGGDSVKEGTESLLLLLRPEIPIFRFAYHCYGIGLTTFIITVLLTGVTWKKLQEKVLVYGCLLFLLFPVFSWLLNGGLYVRDKALIPFLPLLCYVIAVYIEKLEKKEISFRAGVIPYFVTFCLVLLGREKLETDGWWYMLLAESVILLVCFILYSHMPGKIFLLFVPSIVFLFAYQCILHKEAGNILEKEFYKQVTDENIGKAISEILEKEDGFFRMVQSGNAEEKAANLNRIWDMRQFSPSIYSSAYHTGYYQFRTEIFDVEEMFRNRLMQGGVENPEFLKMMGVKYVAGDAIPGYEFYQTVNGINIYKNESAAPVAYVTNQVISREEYETFTFPYNQTLFTEYSVVENLDSDEKETGLEEKKANPAQVSEVSFELQKIPENITITPTALGKRVLVKKKADILLPLPENKTEEERILYLQFEVKNRKKNQDISIWLEGQKNKLSQENHFYYNDNTTFTYAAVIEKTQKEAVLTFGEGDYEISDIQCYIGKKERKNELYQSEFQVDWENTKGNRIQGAVDVKQRGYFITSIPYDTGFQVWIDGKEVQAESVNMAFLGFPIQEGKHKVKIVYHAKGITPGKLLSMIGVLGFVSLQTKQRQKRKKE